MLREIPEIGQEIIKSTDKCFEDIKNDVENGNVFHIFHSLKKPQREHYISDNHAEV